MNLSEWAQSQGVHKQTAYRWFREGTLPVPARRVGPRTILVSMGTAAKEDTGGAGLYARVSSHDTLCVNPCLEEFSYQFLW
jgi:putative resolvase